jgi:hypothetical protein
MNPVVKSGVYEAGRALTPEEGMRLFSQCRKPVKWRHEAVIVRHRPRARVGLCFVLAALSVWAVFGPAFFYQVGNVVGFFEGFDRGMEEGVGLTTPPVQPEPSYEIPNPRETA